ncbi:S8 family peptidase [Acetohalobium arabaticum]|uniref:Peptidase S8 and S53 subtilisin kexin sedolisin n=1 Tax=Acetohalobium arabaticum (strain ATCC 49924 / DSM 5501 / Z-7288) TaxID=574087 RepID=D9QSM7_ACEAZ|nr:S8 family peptidase [Acetohalobium arabaticum]ADL13490.1 peptidase S8 and S53 subtilisin kexin sedolisin [Acetohalobium arabaticum DSM 5501]
MYSADPIETLITILVLQQITIKVSGLNFGGYSGQRKDGAQQQPGREYNEPDQRKKETSKDSKGDSGDYIIVHDQLLNEDELQEKVELQREQGQVRKKLPLINGVACRLEDEDHIAEVESIRGVKRVDEDLTLEIKSLDFELESEQSLSGDMVPWGIEAINTLDAWSDLEVKVGIIDTGIDLNHFDLSPINSGYNTVEPNQRPYDPNGHGTHVAGTISARKNGKGVVGVAPNIELYPVKAFDKDGSAKMSDLIEALQWSIDNNLGVLNMSFGVDKNNNSLREAIAKVHEAGITMVAAAGNDSTAAVNFPARYPEVIAVGAVNKDKRLADFSNYGTGLDIVAPGVNVQSTWKDGQFNELNGTSMATPHVTGIAALILGKFNNLTPARIKRAIKRGATPLQSIAPVKQGAGLVDAAQTIELLKKQT